MKKMLLSAAVSLLTLGLVFHLVSQGTRQEAELGLLITDIAPLLLGGYLLCMLTHTFFRSERYRLLLRGAHEPQIPSMGHSFLATLVRNALVDLLPARAGELGYLALMNRSYQVGADTCLGSMAISFLFDMIALAAVLVLAVAAPWTRGQATWPMLASGAVLLTVVCLVGLWGLFGLLPGWVLPFCKSRSARFKTQRLRKIADFIVRTLESVVRVRDRRLLLAAFLLSLGVRFFKYAGLLLVFQGVTQIHLPELAAAQARQVLPALLAGEGAAALPVPSFMGFGVYEGGSTAVWGLLGFAPAAAMLAMLALHIVTQIAAYALGGAAFVVIALSRRRTAAPATAPKRVTSLLFRIGLAGLLVVALGYAALQWRTLRKAGSLTPPSKGAEVATPPEALSAIRGLTGRHSGHLVWSSNRHGNHDILLMTWPSGAVRRLTRNPHAETYPRISPDGTRVLFARSQATWASQRNPRLWDTWITDLKTGSEQRIATNAFFATWNEDGESITFLRNNDQAVWRNLADGSERVLARPGVGGVKAQTTLKTPDYNAHNGLLAVALRGAQHLTGLLDASGKLQTIAFQTCQMAWATTNTLVYIGHGGRLENVIYRYSLATGATERWLDMPGEFSHEYFPRLSRNGQVLVFGASTGGHENDSADYEIFAWEPASPPESAVRLTFHTGNDCWPDLWLE
jgi:uncharacterized membrane protein YbhN (UPF0104 family)